MTELFTPPYPVPHKSKSSLIKRFYRGWNSWIHVLFEKSYTMKMGENRMPGFHMYVANELSLVDRIMGNAREFPKHLHLTELLDPLIGNSVFSANGDDWEKQRAMVNPAFAHTALNKTFGMMQAAADDFIARVRERDLAQPVDIDPMMTHVAADIIFRTLFSRRLDIEQSDRIHAAFTRFQRYAQSGSMLRLYGLPTLGYIGKAERAAAEIHAVFEPLVAERFHRFHDHGEVAHRDILQSLFETKAPDTGAPFTVPELMEQISTLFLAGHETSASAMTWATYLIAECPEVQQKMREEVEAETGGGPLTLASLKNLTLVRNVVKETLRLYPPVSFLPREVTCPTQMRDKQLKAGAMVVVSPWLIQRNPDNWGCPHAFDPERFERPENQEAGRNAYLPFGKGPRVCVGAGFAQQEAMIVLASLVRAFDVRALPDDRPEPISRLTVRPKNGVRLEFLPR
jgi:cytochrome P450